MTNPTVDDLQSMFPQLPLTAIQDIVEQSGGCEKAMEVLLTVSDNQRGSLQYVSLSRSSPVPLVTNQLVNTSQQRAVHRVEAAHHAAKQLPVDVYWPHPCAHETQFARHKSPYKSSRKKERHSDSTALGILGMLTNLHDDKVGRICASKDKRTPSPSVKIRPAQQYLLPWEQTGNQHACRPCALGSKEGVQYSSQHGSVVPVASGDFAPTPVKPVVSLPHGRAGSPEAAGCVSWPSPALAAHVDCASSPGPDILFDGVVAPSTPPGHSRSLSATAAPPDFQQKIAFLAGMFIDMQLSEEALGHMLSSANGDIEVAVNKILEVQTLIDASADGASLSEETSSLGEDISPEARKDRSIGCLKALHGSFDDDYIEGVLEASAGDVDVAIEILTDLERSEAQRKEQLSKDEELARSLQMQQEQAAADALLPVPTPIPTPLTSTSPPSPAPRSSLQATPVQQRQQQQRPQQAATTASTSSSNYAWEQQNEAVMLSCRIKLLQRAFACPVERDLAIAVLQSSDHDVQQARAKLVEAGLPLKAAKAEAGRHQPGDEAAAGMSDEELRRLRMEQPGVARSAIHDRTQAMYETTRKRGHEYIALKKECNERASQCFKRGDHAEAEALLLEGVRYAQLAEEEHRQAGDKLFNKRNNTLLNTWTLDLHALHIHEALAKLDEHFYLFSQLPSQKVIKVVTGRGAHSPDNVPKLYLAVKDRLLELGHSFEGHLGWFVVYLDAPEGQGGAPAASGSSVASTSTPPPPPPPAHSPHRAAAPSPHQYRSQNDDEQRRGRRVQSPTVPLSAFLKY